MNTSRHHYCRAMLSFLYERAQCLGAVANAPAAAEALNHFKNWSPPNKSNAYVPLSEAFEEPFCVVPRSSRQAWTLALMKEARAQLLPFHADEQALLRQYHLTPQAGIQAAAYALGCTADRVKNLNKRILGKARLHIGNFSNAKAVARYAERLGAEFLT